MLFVRTINGVVFQIKLKLRPWLISFIKCKMIKAVFLILWNNSTK